MEILGIVLSSLAVAVLWGANLGTVYPFVEVVMANQSLHTWVDQRIESAQASADRLRAAVADLENDLKRDDTAVRHELLEELSRRRSDLVAAERVVATTRRLQPLIHKYTPARPFPTLVLIVLLLLAGTLLKDALLLANTLWVGRLAQLATFDLRSFFTGVPCACNCTPSARTAPAAI